MQRFLRLVIGFGPHGTNGEGPKLGESFKEMKKNINKNADVPDVGTASLIFPAVLLGKVAEIVAEDSYPKSRRYSTQLDPF